MKLALFILMVVRALEELMASSLRRSVREYKRLRNELTLRNELRAAAAQGPAEGDRDRVVHHSVIMEFDVPSYRTGVAQQRSQKQEVNQQE